MTLRRRSENPFYLVRVMGIISTRMPRRPSLGFSVQLSLITCPSLAGPVLFPACSSGPGPCPRGAAASKKRALKIQWTVWCVLLTDWYVPSLSSAARCSNQPPKKSKVFSDWPSPSLVVTIQTHCPHQLIPSPTLSPARPSPSTASTLPSLFHDTIPAGTLRVTTTKAVVFDFP